jgi:CDP-6-deoxy-D-xylo-4-hexulose-3-dehydrase
MNINFPIRLVKDTVSNNEIDELVSWLSKYPKLTKGEKTIQLEEDWSKWLGTKYSVFVNSGSSANLAMLYALKLSNRLKNNKIIAPCISWATTVSPAIQLGFDVILCDSEKDSLGIDPDQLEELCKIHKPSCLILVHVLAFPNKMNEIQDICKKHNVVILEDSCESVGSTYNGIKTGNFGLMSTFSTYYGHHFSTIEGGFISTNDFELYELLISIRSHGWSRDLSETTKSDLQNKYNIDDFRNLYTFYYPGFNIRATDLQAFIGINQIKTLDSKVKARYENLLIYDKLIKNNHWKIKINQFVSCFAYPIIHPNKNLIIDELLKCNIECRPLICGSISRQPFYYNLYGKREFNIADEVHDYGFYLPNNPDMSLEEISYISEIVNRFTE